MTLTRSTCSSKSRCTRCWVRGTEAGCVLRNATARPSGVARIQASVGVRGGLAVERLGLAEIGDVLRALPFRVIDASVDVDGESGRDPCKRQTRDEKSRS